MNRKNAKGHAWVAALLLLAGCGKPPKTTVDVDTMREASFVKDIKDEPSVPAPASAGSGISATSEPNPAEKEDAPMLDPASARIDDAAAKKPRGREKITKSECGRMFDHFLDLVLTSDPRFANVGAEGQATVRQIAAQDSQLQELQKDCERDVSRSKYACAIAAKTSLEWQACLK